MTRPGIEPRSPGPLANTLTGPVTAILNACKKEFGNQLKASRMFVFT